MQGRPARGVDVEADIDLAGGDEDVIDGDVLPYTVGRDVIVQGAAAVAGDFRSRSGRRGVLQAHPRLQLVGRVVLWDVDHLVDALLVGSRRVEVSALSACPRRLRRVDSVAAVDAEGDGLAARVPLSPVAVMRGSLEARVI